MSRKHRHAEEVFEGEFAGLMFILLIVIVSLVAGVLVGMCAA